MPHPLPLRIASLWVQDALSHGALTLFPVTGPDQTGPAYSLLADAVGRGTLEVRELPSPSITQLLAVNSGDRPVLIMDGEELLGGRQDRMTNSSVLLPTGETVLPVSCVEQGRWHDASPRFSPREAGYPSLRASRTRQVRDSLRARGRHESDQLHVWREVEERRVAADVASDTSALRDVYEGERPRLEEYERALPCPPGAVGMVVALGGRVVSADVFDSAGTMRALWPRLVRAAALDALRTLPAEPPAKGRAVRLLGRVKEARHERHRSPGLGEDVRLAGAGIIGASLQVDSVVVHAALFRERRPVAGIASQSVRRSLRDDAR